ncbi:MAG: ribosome maturation factor RimP [Acidobacteriota bacterium]
MKRPEIDDELFEQLAGAARRSDCELIHVARKGDTLQLILDKTGGITLEDCETVSRDASALLDLEDYGGQRYLLEVSSPGLDRELYSIADYERFVGRRVKMTFLGGPQRAKQTRRGLLESCDGQSVTFVDGQNEQSHQIPLDDIQTTRLEIEL